MEGLIIIKVRKALGIKMKQGFLFTLETFMLQSNYTQLAISDWDKMDGEKFLNAMIYNAAKLYNLTQGKKVRFNEDYITKWCDNMTNGELKSLYASFMKSKLGGETLESLILKNEDEDQKKK